MGRVDIVDPQNESAPHLHWSNPSGIEEQIQELRIAKSECRK
jgi:hypothetical protein